MTRARGSISQRHVAGLLRGLKGYSYGTIQRIEALDAVPDDEVTRGRAWVLVTLYGFDPVDFDLTDDDKPPFVDPSALHDAAVNLRREQDYSQSRCSVRGGRRSARSWVDELATVVPFRWSQPTLADAA